MRIREWGLFTAALLLLGAAPVQAQQHDSPSDVLRREAGRISAESRGACSYGSRYDCGRARNGSRATHGRLSQAELRRAHDEWHRRHRPGSRDYARLHAQFHRWLASQGYREPRVYAGSRGYPHYPVRQYPDRDRHAVSRYEHHDNGRHLGWYKHDKDRWHGDADDHDRGRDDGRHGRDDHGHHDHH